MSYLPTNVLGTLCRLYWIFDIFGRKIVGFEFHENGDSDHAVALLRRPALAEGVHALARETTRRPPNFLTSPNPIEGRCALEAPSCISSIIYCDHLSIKEPDRAQ